MQSPQISGKPTTVQTVPPDSPAHSQTSQQQASVWFPDRSCLEKLPFIQALRPLDGEIPDSFYHDLLQEHMSCLAVSSLKKTRQLTKEERERQRDAIDKATKSVTKLYRKASLKIHPDRFGNQFAKQFEELQHATIVLRDEKFRQDYLDEMFRVFEYFAKGEKQGKGLDSQAQKDAFVVRVHNTWVENNRAKFQPENPSARKPDAQPQPLQILGGISTHTPKHISVQSINAKRCTARIAMPVLQPAYEFYSYCKEVVISYVDGTEEVVLRRLRRKDFEHEHQPEWLQAELSLPGHSTWYVVWYAVLEFQASDGRFETKETPRSAECLIDMMLEEDKRLIAQKPALVTMAKQSAGELRALLDKMAANEMNLMSLDSDELELRYWKLHRTVTKARGVEHHLVRVLRFMGTDESTCPECVLLNEVLSKSFLPKAELENVLEGKRVKNELKAFKWIVAGKLEAGDAAAWIESVTEEELESLGGQSNRLYQLLVDGKKSKSLLVDPDTLQAAAKREDFFSAKQCDRLLSLRDETVAHFAAETERIQKLEDEMRQKEEARKKMEERANLMDRHTTVRLVGLKNQSSLNGALGTYMGLGEGDRYIIRLIDDLRDVSLLKENFHAYNIYGFDTMEDNADDDVVHDNYSPTFSVSEVADDEAVREKEAERVQPLSAPLVQSNKSEDLVSRSMQVPSKNVGKLMGPQRANLLKLESDTGIKKISVDKESVNGMRKVRFCGTSEAVDKVQTYIEDNIVGSASPRGNRGALLGTETLALAETGLADTRLTESNRVLLSHSERTARRAEDAVGVKKNRTLVTMCVPNDAVGRLVGKQGTNLQKLVESSAVDAVNVVKLPRKDKREVQVTGHPAAVERFEKSCRSIAVPGGSSLQISGVVRTPLSHSVQSRRDPRERKKPIFQTIFHAPSDRIGVLIGKQGSTLQRVADVSKVYSIYVSNEVVDGKREVQITGDLDSVEKAEASCASHISGEETGRQDTSLGSSSSEVGSSQSEQNNQKQQIQNSPIARNIQIPKRLVGELIGRQGSNLIQLQKVTGAKVKVADRVVDGKREVRIKGRQACVEKAVEMVEEFCAANAARINVSGATGSEAGDTASDFADNDRATPREAPDSPPRVERRNGDLGAVAPPELVHVTTTGSEANVSQISQYPPSPARMPTSSSTFTTEDGLLQFLRAQAGCLKCPPEKFYNWLLSEDIVSLEDLAEAASDDDFVRSEMQSNGLKGFKKTPFLKAATSAVKDGLYSGTSQQNGGRSSPSKEAVGVPGDLECPLSLTLMTIDPVVAMDGFTYERAAILEWFARSKAGSGVVRSPMNNEVLTDLTLTPVTNIRTLAREHAARQNGST